MSDNWNYYNYTLTIYPPTISDSGLSNYYWLLTVLIPIFLIILYKFCRRGNGGVTHHHHHEDKYQNVDINIIQPPAPKLSINSKSRDDIPLMQDET